MNKSLINKGLIAVVAIVWLLIGYRLVNNFFGKSEIMEYQAPLETAMPENLLKRDTFQLSLLKRDPFLGTYAKSSKKSRNTATISNTPIIRTPKTVQWPKIEYYGFVKSENNSSPLLLFKVNDKLHRIRKRGKIDELLVKEVYEDSVLIMNGSQKRIFARQ